LCPEDVGGRGDSGSFADCPAGSSGWYAHRLATGEGSDLLNLVGGTFASLGEGINEDRCPECLKGIAPNVTPGGIAGYTRHGLRQAMARDGVGVSPRAILDAVRNPRQVVEQAGGKARYVGDQATVVLNQAKEVVTTWARNRNGWRVAP
jgi:hypothetical protein